MRMYVCVCAHACVCSAADAPHVQKVRHLFLLHVFLRLNVVASFLNLKGVTQLLGVRHKACAIANDNRKGHTQQRQPTSV